MKKLDNSFIDAITKESAYVFTLCINKLIDEDFFKS